MPKLIRFVIINSVIGVLIGWGVAFLLIWMNVGGLGNLYANASNKFAVLALMGMSFGVTFGFGYLSTAVMLMPDRKDDFDRL